MPTIHTVCALREAKGIIIKMNLNYKALDLISDIYGESFYLLDSKQFIINLNELQTAFRKIYSNSHIAYSYKTNYTPKLCKIVDQLGGYAEIVSDMEYELTKRIGVKPEKVIFNGPYKNHNAVCELLLSGGTVNIDSIYELDIIKQIADENPKKTLNVGIRCNFDIGDNVVSRFGFDINSEDFNKVLSFVATCNNINLIGIHCHFATRCLETWTERAKGMIKLIDDRLGDSPEYVDLGGGLFGKMGDSLKAQFDYYIPTYEDYANAVAKKFAEHYPDQKPMLFIEPGSALVGDAMKFAAKVINIKVVRGKPIATLLGSIYNINPTLNKKNPPIHVYHKSLDAIKAYENLDFGGFTCIESDYMYRGYTGGLEVGDYIVFDNVGSYSLVLKPPFILPNFAVVEYNDVSNKVELIKRRENFDDLFHTFQF